MHEHIGYFRAAAPGSGRPWLPNDIDPPCHRASCGWPWQAYGHSKTGNALFAVTLTGRYQADGITANAVMPGVISTGLFSHLRDDELRRLGWTEQGGTLVRGPGWVSAG